MVTVCCWYCCCCCCLTAAHLGRSPCAEPRRCSATDTTPVVRSAPHAHWKWTLVRGPSAPSRAPCATLTFQRARTSCCHRLNESHGVVHHIASVSEHTCTIKTSGSVEGGEVDVEGDIVRRKLPFVGYCLQNKSMLNASFQTPTKNSYFFLICGFDN